MKPEDPHPYIRQCTRCYMIFDFRKPRCPKCGNPEFAIYEAIDFDLFRERCERK